MRGNKGIWMVSGVESVLGMEHTPQLSGIVLSQAHQLP